MSAVQEKKSLIVAPESARQPLPAVSADASSLMKIIDRAAMDPNFDVAKLQQLLAVKKEWDQNEARKAFVTAMAAFKSDQPAVYKDKENKQYGSRYTSIGNLVNTVNAALSPHRLSARWDIDQSSAIKVTCILTHHMGHSESCSMTGPLDTSGQKNPLQQIKSTVTYLKIATFEAITGLASSDGNADDDGNGAGGGNGNTMEEKALADHLAAIDAASDRDSLNKAFGKAWNAAEALKDKAAQAQMIEHRDARRKAIGAKA